MTTRRTLLTRAGLLAAGGAALFLVRDRLPWPPLEPRFADGRATPWLPIPRQGLIEVPAVVNGRRLRAIVDTGAEFTAVDAAFAERAGLERPLAAPVLAYGVSGRPSLAHTVRLDLRLPGFAIDRVRAAALDLAAISAATGRDFQLLIGRDVLSRVVLEADFTRDRVRLVAADRAATPARAMILPLTPRSGAPTVPVAIEDAAPLDLLVDTGASGWIALSEAAAAQAGLLAPGRQVSQAHSVGLGGLSVDRLVTARRVRLGPVTLRDIDVQIYSPATHAPAPSGLIGLRLLRRFGMAVDLGRRRLVLQTPALSVVSGTNAR